MASTIRDVSHGNSPLAGLQNSMEEKPDREAVRKPERLQVGILGAARIAKITWAALHEAGNVVTIIGCRDVARGEVLAREVATALGIPEKVPRIGSYDDVVTASDVDVVYIPIPVTQRDEWVKKCIANNKHVVGEKPAAESAEQLKAWIEGLHAKQLLYMDGTMLSHGLRVAAVAQAVKKLGEVRYINSRHSFCGDESFLANNIRVDPTLEPAGALGDLGWFSIRYFLHLMEGQMPVEVMGRVIKKNAKGGIIEFAGDVTFLREGGETVTATLFSSYDCCDEEMLSVSSTGGVLRMIDFCHPVEDKPAGWVVEKLRRMANECEVRVTQETERFTSDENTRVQRVNLWRAVESALLPTGSVASDGCNPTSASPLPRFVAEKNSAEYWAVLSWKTQAIMDKLLESSRIHERIHHSATS